MLATKEITGWIRNAWGRYTLKVTGLRRCEVCGGAGPCLWDIRLRRYACCGCYLSRDVYFKSRGRLLGLKLCFWRIWSRP
jgi:hypothetical protein